MLILIATLGETSCLVQGDNHSYLSKITKIPYCAHYFLQYQNMILGREERCNYNKKLPQEYFKLISTTLSKIKS